MTYHSATHRIRQGWRYVPTLGWVNPRREPVDPDQRDETMRKRFVRRLKEQYFRDFYALPDTLPCVPGGVVSLSGLQNVVTETRTYSPAPRKYWFK